MHCTNTHSVLNIIYNNKYIVYIKKKYIKYIEYISYIYNI